MTNENNEYIVCDCIQTSESEILEMMLRLNITTLEDLSKETNVGNRCRKCVKPNPTKNTREIYLVDIVEKANILKAIELSLEPTPVEIRPEIDEIPEFATKPVITQFKIINQAITDNVREYLHNDGGDCSIEDIITFKEDVNVYIKYLGACGSCGGAAGTLTMIEVMLKEKVYNNIRVIEYKK